jgi:hypothetical protein
VDLVKFFELVRKKNFNFLQHGTVADIASEVRAAAGLRSR